MAVRNLCNIIIIIINPTTDQPCGHAVLKSSIHAGKSERSKNSCLNLLYTHCSLSAVCSNYLASAVPTSLDCKPHEPTRVSELMWALLCSSSWQKKIWKSFSELFLYLLLHAESLTILIHFSHFCKAVSQLDWTMTEAAAEWITLLICASLLSC